MYWTPLIYKYRIDEIKGRENFNTFILGGSLSSKSRIKMWPNQCGAHEVLPTWLTTLMTNLLSVLKSRSNSSPPHN